MAINYTAYYLLQIHKETINLKWNKIIFENATENNPKFIF